jgi:isochorismate synthase
MFQEILLKATASLKDNKPFVLYRKPKEGVVRGLYQHSTDLYTITDFTETGFVFAPFNNKHSVIWLKPDEVLEAHVEHSTPKVAPEVNAYPFAKDAGVAHKKLVQKGINEIRSGNLNKVVLSTTFKVPIKDDPVTIYTNLLALYPNAFCYLWYHPKAGLWLGATPEILLSTEGNNLTTMSLAGTLPVEEGEQPVWSNKEIKEQEMVTNYVANVLQEKLENLKKTPLETVRAGSVWHLRTKLFGTYNTKDFGDIITGLHPTPAVCGLPTSMAKAFLEENESYTREYYTGYLGELNSIKENLRMVKGKNIENKVFRTRRKASNLYVNLRCMQIKGKEAIIYVGGGITLESDAQQEWEEICNKSKTMLSALMYENEA